MLVVNEKTRGALLSIVSGVTSGALTFAGVKAGLSAQTSATIFLYGVGSFATYIADILFAKKMFRNAAGDTVEVPYSNLKERFQYLMLSFMSHKLLRFIVTVVLDTLIGIALLRAAIKFMNENKFLMNFKYRDTVTSVLIATLTFVLYVNVLRFDWAYSDDEGTLVVDVLVHMWLTVVLVIFAVTYVDNDDVGVKVATMNTNTVPVFNRWGMNINDLS